MAIQRGRKNVAVPVASFDLYAGRTASEIELLEALGIPKSIPQTKYLSKRIDNHYIQAGRASRFELSKEYLSISENLDLAYRLVPAKMAQSQMSTAKRLDDGGFLVNSTHTHYFFTPQEAKQEIDRILTQVVVAKAPTVAQVVAEPLQIEATNQLADFEYDRGIEIMETYKAEVKTGVKDLKEFCTDLDISQAAFKRLKTAYGKLEI